MKMDAGDRLKAREKFRNDVVSIYNPLYDNSYISMKYCAYDIISLLFLRFRDPQNLCLACLKDGSICQVLIHEHECELC